MNSTAALAHWKIAPTHAASHYPTTEPNHSREPLATSQISMKLKETKWTLKKKLKIIWVSAGVFFMIWLLYSMQAHNVDENLFRSDNQVSYENKDDYYLYTPTENSDEVLVFYPGALVQTKAYLPLCREIAKNNIKVYLIKMPWRQAAIGYNKPKELNILGDTSKVYTLVGHSQGGKMAAQFVYENPNLLDRLILIGTTHPRDISLADHKIPILKIYGSNDGIADEESIFKNKPKLPEHSQFVKIVGGNHSQFGYYGFQLGDNFPSIDRKQQHSETLKSIMAFIRN